MAKKVYVLEGNRLQRHRQLDIIRESLGEVETIVFDDEDNYEFVSHFIGEYNLLSDTTRLIIINRLPSIEDVAKSYARTKMINGFVKIIPAIPLGNIVVFNNLGLSGKKFISTVKKYGEVCEFPQKVDVGDARKKIQKHLSAQEKSLTPDQLDLIAEVLSNERGEVDLDVLYLMLIKLDHLMGSKKKMEYQDLFAACGHSQKFIVWSLFDLLDKHDYAASFKYVMNNLLSNKGVIGGVLEILGSMVWRYGLLLCIKAGTKAGLSVAQLKDGLTSFRKLKREGKAQSVCMAPAMKEGLPVRLYGAAMVDNTISGRYKHTPVAERYGFAHLVLIYYALIQAMIKMRSKCTEAEYILSIQFILMTICKKIKKRATLDLLDNPELRWFKEMGEMENELLK